MTNVTQILHRTETGNPPACEELVLLVYGALRQREPVEWRASVREQTLPVTPLVSPLAA